MKRVRKTEAQKRQEWAAAKERCWEQFHAKLRAVRTLADAVKLHSEAPPPDTPGRSYYANLGFFLMSFAPPAGANGIELSLYIKIVQEIDLEPDTKQKIELALRQAIDSRD